MDKPQKFLSRNLTEFSAPFRFGGRIFPKIKNKLKNIFYTTGNCRKFVPEFPENSRKIRLLISGCFSPGNLFNFREFPKNSFPGHYPPKIGL